MYNSDLNWLPLSERKGIELPKVVYEPYNNQAYAGYYSEGTLTIVESDEFCPSSTIAHEFRHYTQDLKGQLGKLTENGLHYFRLFSYNKAIRLYFRTQWHEMDALLFERKIAPVNYSKFWLEGLILPERLDENIEM